jgi:hypothetical protein
MCPTTVLELHFLLRPRWVNGIDRFWTLQLSQRSAAVWLPVTWRVTIHYASISAFTVVRVL